MFLDGNLLRFFPFLGTSKSIFLCLYDLYNLSRKLTDLWCQVSILLSLSFRTLSRLGLHWEAYAVHRMSISSCSSTCSFSEGRYQSNTTSTPTTPSEHRWSDVIPPKTALKFAVVWDSDDLVVFSGGELLEDSRTEELLLGSPLSPSDACSQAFSVGQSTMPLSDKSSTMLYFRDNMGSVLTENHPPPTSDSEKRMIWGRTQTSSTLEGLDVYLRGSLMGQAHRNNRYYSCLDNLDGQFEFDPRTSFAKEYLRKVESKDIVDDAVTDEGFFEVEIAPRQHQILAKPSSRCDIHPTDAHSVASTTKTSDFVSIEGDDASSIWSTVEAPVIPSYLGYTSMDQRPHLKRRLTKPRPADMPAPPSEVLKREVFSHEVSLPPRNAQEKHSTQIRQRKSFAKLVCQRSKEKPVESDQWICIEVSHELRQRFV